MCVCTFIRDCVYFWLIPYYDWFYSRVNSYCLVVCMRTWIRIRVCLILSYYWFASRINDCCVVCACVCASAISIPVPICVHLIPYNIIGLIYSLSSTILPLNILILLVQSTISALPRACLIPWTIKYDWYNNQFFYKNITISNILMRILFPLWL